jgi:hypothetical protein
VEWSWNAQEGTAFQTARKELAQVQELAFYNPDHTKSMHPAFTA